MRRSLITVTALCTMLCGTAPIHAESDESTIPAIAVGSGRLDTLVAAVTAADLAGALSSEGPFTVFAPTDDAFAKLGDETIANLLQPGNRGTLVRILKHHVVPGRLAASSLVGTESVQTLAGTDLPLELVRNRLLVGEAVVETADISASNGIVHVIDRVLLPPREVAPLETLLESTISRGAPIYNDGDPAGCAAVYATALEAVVLGSGFGLTDEMRSQIETRLADIATNQDARDRAWAYRRIIDSLFAAMQDGTMTMAAAPGARRSTSAAEASPNFPAKGRLVFGFEDAAEGQRWQTVLDGVMGGRSTGDIRVDGGHVVFEGATSLENNGGFSSMRASVPDGTFADADAIRLVVKGDGRDYKLSVSTSRSRGAGGYWKSFPTTAGTWTEVIVPIEELDRQFMGQRLNGRVNPDDIKGVQFYIYDKKAGPFRLEIDSIEAITLDRGDLFDA